MTHRVSLFVLLTLLVTTPVYAADLILSAPPRESAEEGEQIYGTLAKYLSQALDRPVRYQRPGNWGLYQAGLQQDKYDIVFDGPHFVSWRIAKTRHTPVAKLAGTLQFDVLVLTTDKAKNIKELGGRPACGLAPPNLATLTMNNLFPTTRLPYLVKTNSFKESFDKLLAGKCRLAVLRHGMQARFDNQKKTRVIDSSKPLPNQAFTASARLSPKQIEDLQVALTSPALGEKAADFMAKYSPKKPLEKASAEEFKDLFTLLKDFWGF